MKEIKLTPREKEVFNLLMSRGCSNKVMAKLLSLGESTIKMHMSNVLKKHGVQTRTQLLAFVKTSTKV